MKDNILRAWKSGQFTEEEIVQTLNITYLEFRKALNHDACPPPGYVPLGLKQEIHTECEADLETQYRSVDWIARNYMISLNQVACYKYGNFAEDTADKSVIIPELLAKGVSPKEIAYMLNISPATVTYHNPNSKNYKRTPKVSEDKWQEMIEVYKTNTLSVSEIARLYKVNRTTLINRIKKEAQDG